LADKLEYIAPLRNDSPALDAEQMKTGVSVEPSTRLKKEKDSAHTLYLDQLRRWVLSEPNPHVEAVLRYVEGETIIADLTQQQVLQADGEGNLLTQWQTPGALPAIFKVLTATAGERNQRSAVIRWIVELRTPDGDARLWLNPGVQRSWQQFVAKQR